MPAPRIRYQTIEVGNFDIHLRTLWDRQQYQDDGDIAENLGISPASWALFGVVWDSGVVLAHLMLHQEIRGLHILEVGCGIGLASLVLHRRSADITATDRHPEARGFLLQNVALNGGGELPFVREGWDDPDSSLGRFDLIVGSDLLYEPDHVALLSGFIDRHAQPHCEVILVDPGRGLGARFSKRMDALGYVHSQRSVQGEDAPDRNPQGKILTYSR